MGGNEKKTRQLGMPIGTATAKLRKAIIYDMMCQLERNLCYRCGKLINSIEDMSIEHKEAWLDSGDPIDKFFDLNNIAFSHIACNIGTKRTWNKGNMAKHGTTSRYRYGCHCLECRIAKADYDKQYEHRDRLQSVAQSG